MKKFFTILLLLSSVIVYGQNVNPVNTNYLIYYGISPRVLDIAANQFMQDGNFVNSISLEINKNGEIKKYDIDVVYNPSLESEMDIIVLNKTAELNKKDRKRIAKYIENSHYFSRMAEDYIYDEKTLKTVSKEGDNLILEYYYKKKDIDPYIKNVKRMKGTIFIKNGKLEKITLVNTKKLKNNVTKYKKTIYYQQPEGQGYIATKIVEEELIEKGKNKETVKIVNKLVSYHDLAGKALTWPGKTEAAESGKVIDTIKVKLGGVLPFLGKEARKSGYKIPSPYGVSAIVYAHNQLMEFTGLEVGFDTGDLTNLNGFFDLNSSSVSQTTYMSLAKADAWIFPFLNVMVMAGSGNNKVDGELVIDEDLRDLINSIPDWIFDIPNLPRSIPIRTNITSEAYGGGITLAGGAGNFNLAMNYQFVFTKVIEANTTNFANVFTPLAGYMTPNGINIMIGAMGQFYDTNISGFIDLTDKNGNAHKLNYRVNFEPNRWNAIIGVYKSFNKHWEMSFQAGFGERSSLNALFGYRF